MLQSQKTARKRTRHAFLPQAASRDWPCKHNRLQIKTTLLKIVVGFIFVSAVGFGIIALPDNMVAKIGGVFSPRGEISRAFVPVFHKALVVIGTIFGFLLYTGVAWWRLWLTLVKHIFRQIETEFQYLIRSLRFHLARLSIAEWAVLGILLAMGLGLRLWYLRQPIRFDEATTVLLYASQPWYIGLANYSMPNNHLLNTLMVRVCILIGNEQEWIVRLPALMAGFMCLPMLYLYARLMYSRPAAILALAWLSVNLAFVDMSTNARGYTMVVLFGLVSQVSTVFIFRRGYWLACLFNALAIGLGLIAVPTALLVVASGVLWGILFFHQYHSAEQVPFSRLYLWVGSCGVGMGIALLGYAPMLMIMGVEPLIANEWVRPLGWNQFIIEFPAQLLAYGTYMSRPFSGVWAALLIIPAIVYLISWKKIEKTGISLPFIFFGVALVLLMLNRRYPLWGLAPMWMYGSVVAFAAFAAGLMQLLPVAWNPQRILQSSLVVAISIVLIGAYSILRTHPFQTAGPAGKYGFPDIESVTAYLANHMSPNDVILADNALVVYQYHAKQMGATNLNWGRNVEAIGRIFLLETVQPNPQFRNASWAYLHRLGIKETNQMSLAANFSHHRIWTADISQ